MSAVAVKVLVTDATWNSVLLSTGSGLSTLVTPWHAWISRPSASTPTARPGMPNSLAVASTNPDSSCSCVIALTLPLSTT